jgi:hypothetical protein
MKTRENRPRGLAGLAMTAACALLAGCCVEAPKEPFGAARIVSEPAGANVVSFKDNATLGTTPLDQVWETEDGKAEFIQLILTRPGHADAVTSFWINPRHATREDAAAKPRTVTVRLKEAR